MQFLLYLHNRTITFPEIKYIHKIKMKIVNNIFSNKPGWGSIKLYSDKHNNFKLTDKVDSLTCNN